MLAQKGSIYSILSKVACVYNIDKLQCHGDYSIIVGSLYVV